MDVWAGGYQIRCGCEACDMQANNGLRTRMAVCPNCDSKHCVRARSHTRRCERAEPIEKGKTVCACGWFGHSSNLVTAPHPTKAGALLLACPRCGETDGHFEACDVIECRRPAVSGFNTKAGWRYVCSYHNPEVYQEATNG